jgi:hypothetical protein
MPETSLVDRVPTLLKLLKSIGFELVSTYYYVWIFSSIQLAVVKSNLKIVLTLVAQCRPLLYAIKRSATLGIALKP